MAGAFACGALAVLFSALIAAAALVFTEEAFMAVAVALVAAHGVVMIIEGIITLFCVAFLRKVDPSLLPGFIVRPQGKQAGHAGVNQK
jgi:cobalt/nickel transport system permease protein